MEHDYTEREKMLLRRALAPARSSATLMGKVQAIDVLSREGTPVPIERVREELQVALSDPFGTHLSARAASMALRLLGLLDGDLDEAWPSSTPDLPAGPDYWPYDTSPARWGQEPWRELDDQMFDGWLTDEHGVRQRLLRPVTQGERDAHRRRLEGPPSWSRNAGLGEETSVYEDGAANAEADLED